MAITPNVPNEQAAKQQIRANTGGGANSYWTNPSIVELVNGADVAQVNKQLYQLVVSGAATTNFVISGSNIVASGLNGNSTVSNFVSLMTANAVFSASGGYSLVVWAKPTDYLKNTTTSFLINAPKGVTITDLVTSGFGAANPAQIRDVDLVTTSGAYPSYYQTPFAAPTWIDDATVHAYPITGFGNTTQDTTRTEQKQVRQIQTSYSETMIMDGYYTVYSGSLYQTEQKNTRQQQC